MGSQTEGNVDVTRTFQKIIRGGVWLWASQVPYTRICHIAIYRLNGYTLDLLAQNMYSRWVHDSEPVGDVSRRYARVEKSKREREMLVERASLRDVGPPMLRYGKRVLAHVMSHL